MNYIIIICIIMLAFWALWINRGLRLAESKGILYYALGLLFVGLQMQLSLFDLVVYFESLFWLFLFLIRRVNFRCYGLYIVSAPLIIFWGVQIHYVHASDISTLGFAKTALLLTFLFSRIWVLLRDFGKRGYLYFPLNLLIVYTVLLPFYSYGAILVGVLWPMIALLFLTLIVEYKDSALRRHLYLFIFLIFSFNILSNSGLLFLYFFPIILIFYYLVYLNDQHKTFSYAQAVLMAIMAFYPGEFFIRTAVELLGMKDNTTHLVEYLAVWIVFIAFWASKVDLIVEIKTKVRGGFSFDKDLVLGVCMYVTYMVWSLLWF